MRKKIYVIMVFTKLPNEDCDFGEYRIIGFYSDKKIAIEMVKDNACDIYETLYEYALIEEVEEGLYQPACKGQRWWFKYDKKGIFEEIEEPDGVGHYCGLTIG